MRPIPNTTHIVIIARPPKVIKTPMGAAKSSATTPTMNAISGKPTACSRINQSLLLASGITVFKCTYSERADRIEMMLDMEDIDISARKATCMSGRISSSRNPAV
mmetsp:Transcript_10481/g.16395  ORF Transcript_10481/g.16395 Transcript_10481/m.16395 type:complete len:105 (-) Transcript_10481:82-396(-)